MDLVVVFGGTNDFGHGDLPFGEFGDEAEESFCGSCYVLYKKLVEKYPAVPVVVITPLHRTGKYELVNKFGKSRKPLCEYVDIIRRTAERFSLPVIDLFAAGGLQPCVDAQNKLYFVDGLHPNDASHEKLAKTISNYIENNLP